MTDQEAMVWAHVYAATVQTVRGVDEWARVSDTANAAVREFREAVKREEQEAGKDPSPSRGWVEAVMVAAVRFSMAHQMGQEKGSVPDFIELLAPHFVNESTASKEECIKRLAVLFELEDGAVRKLLRAGLGGVAP